MEAFQVLDGARTAEIERVFTNADVTGPVALSLRDMRELVLDRGALPQSCAPGGRLDLLAQPLLQLLIFRDRHGAAVPEFSGRAVAAQGAVVAHVRVKLDDRAEGEWLHLPTGTLDRPVTEIEPKRGFGKQLAIVRLPRLADDLAPPAEHLVHERAVDVPAIK
jgi:hypothetical protein